MVGDGKSERVQRFQAALAEVLPGAEFRLLEYVDVLKDPSILEDCLAEDCVLRIESPGQCFEVSRRLLQRGCEHARNEDSPWISIEELADFQEDFGRIFYPRQWFLGYRDFLNSVYAMLQETDAHVEVMSDPREIAVMFDKRACHQRMVEAGIPVPDSLREISDFQSLIDAMSRQHMNRVFVKLAHGSSASGVMAFHASENRLRATTTCELVRDARGLRLYNSLRVPKYTSQTDICDIVNLLCEQGVHVEQWLPKARAPSCDASDGGLPEEFDLRVMVIGGKVQHLVVRQSSRPMTNLHLNSRRGDVPAVLEMLGDQWARIQETCRQTLLLFPGCHYAGIDVAVMPGCRRHAVLEINAFGDLLPRIEHNGLSTYAAEISAF